MVKLKKLIIEDLDKSEIGRKFVGTIDELVFEKSLIESDLDKPKIGEKFIGDISEIILDTNIQQSNYNQKIKVINKKSGVAYQVNKDWYQKHKDLYSTSHKNISPQKTSLKKPFSGDKRSKFAGERNQIEKQKDQLQPKNAEQFIEKYIKQPIKVKEISRQTKTNVSAVLKLNSSVYKSITNYTDRGYRFINPAIRSNFKSLYGYSKQYVLEQINNIREGLSKCESYNGVCFRVLTNSKSDINFGKKPIQLNLKPGDIFHCKAFTSTTYDIRQKGIQRIESTFLNNDGDYELFIKSKKGKIIQGLSENASQGQVLFDINSKFKVIDIKDEEVGLPFRKFKIKKLYLVQV